MLLGPYFIIIAGQGVQDVVFIRVRVSGWVDGVQVSYDVGQEKYESPVESVAGGVHGEMSGVARSSDPTLLTVTPPPPALSAQTFYLQGKLVTGPGYYGQTGTDHS